MEFVIKNVDYFIYIQELKKKNQKPIFDAIITDPPYNISQKNNFETIGRYGIDFENETITLIKSNELKMFLLY